MALYRSYVNANNTKFKTDRGTIIELPPSMEFPYPKYLVTCAKHGIPMEIVFSLDWDGDSLEKALNRAFDDCPGCVDEKTWALTKFPEGAEI